MNEFYGQWNTPRNPTTVVNEWGYQGHLDARLADAPPVTDRPSRGLLATAGILCVLGLAGAATAITLAVTGMTTADASATQPTPTPTHAVTPAAPAQPTTPVSPVSPVSQQTKVLQQQLGQLNYYEGPVDGIMGPQTTAAISYLQRDAGLPRTGVMNAATQNALTYMLEHGNNQMGGS